MSGQDKGRAIEEKDVIGCFDEALAKEQFIVCYQPQYDHSTGMLVGAEALVRWQHPQRGLLLPDAFLPALEAHERICALDMYVFERVCALVRLCLDKGMHVVPVAANFSRLHAADPQFTGKLEAIRERYGVPARYLHIELTESVFIGDSRRPQELIRQLHACGYTVEMDDFGSGYSSLNLLKDTDVDCFKLDMGFLTGAPEKKKGGVILSAVVRMAKWLGVGVIAEGVETVQQADFLRSIGCDCVQGYLYAGPLSQEAFLERLSGSAVGETIPKMELIDGLSAVDFWSPESQETLIFSNYVGGAAIFEYRDGQIEILRVNRKYVSEIGMNLEEKDVVQSDPLAVFDEQNRSVYLDMLGRAIATGEEQECETWRTLASACCGEEKLCIRSSVRMIGHSGDVYLFYAMIRNVTGERSAQLQAQEDERRFQIASEQVNIYYWEYTVATKEMRPCFRCMRDLGLPLLLRNYPESAFEMGVFPPEVHDMYRSWHRQVAAGVPELEAIMPLTMDRIPFRVRYTTEFDESGRPVKAYGSAALVKDAAAVPSEIEHIDKNNERVLELIAQHSDRVVLLYDLKTRTIRFNDAIADQYGMNNRTIGSLFDEERILPESLESAHRILRNIEKGVPYGRENILFRYRENYQCWLDLKYTTLFDGQKQPVAAFLSYADITAQVEMRKRSEEDGMTGLYNRATAEAKIRARIARAEHPGVLLLLDMDGLKHINDTYGHREGDRAIRGLARLLKGHFRKSDVIGRFGGDEFIVYLDDAAAHREAVCAKLDALMDKLVHISLGSDSGAQVSCSIGCAAQAEGETSFDALYRQADAALYCVKRGQGRKYAFYEAQMDAPGT